jgi:ComF family protein
MKKIIEKIYRAILNLFLPEKCFGCGKKETYLCPTCMKKLPPPENKQWQVLAAVSYQSETIKKAIWALKYKKAQKIARPLANLLHQRINFNDIQSIQKCMPDSTLRICLVPIPLSKKRLRERGFNQAELIARNLSDILKTSRTINSPRFDIDCLNHVLYKTRHTRSQVEIKDRRQRLNNLKNSFAVKNRHLINNRVVFVLDDVATTGATINEARRALKKAGAKQVIGIVVAT